MGSIGIIVIYVVALGLMMYFLAIKPQKKQQKAQQQLMDSIEIGDYVLTTSGFGKHQFPLRCLLLFIYQALHIEKYIKIRYDNKQ